jgi:predicted nucleic acid-binding protein
LNGVSAAEFPGHGSPSWRVADIVIGVIAAAMAAILLACNANDFAGVPHFHVEHVGE